MTNIAVINSSTVLTDQAVQAALPSLQKQITRDFAPVWGVGARLSFYSNNAVIPPGMWWIAIMDNSDQAGALGYHDKTSEGLPIGKVFAETTAQDGELWTVCASHELLEMLADSAINRCVTSDDGSTLYSLEVADAVEETTYDIDGVTVSNFCYPAWFDSSSPAGTQLDYLSKCTAPFQLLSGGYIGIMNLTSTQGWTQIYGQRQKLKEEMRGSSNPMTDNLRYKAIPRAGSRRERRRRPRSQWLLSKDRTQLGMGQAKPV